MGARASEIEKLVYKFNASNSQVGGLTEATLTPRKRNPESSRGNPGTVHNNISVINCEVEVLKTRL